MSCPIERPRASSHGAGNADSGGASGGFSTPKGSVSHQSLSYLTADRLYRISQSMSDLDWQLLGFLHESRFATGHQLVRCFWQTHDGRSSQARAARRTLRRLTDWRVLETLPRRIGGIRTGSDGIVYQLGRAGVRLLAARGTHGPRVETPGTLHLAHTLATTELALRLREADRTGELELIEVQQEPVCWRSYPAALGVQRVLKPDLFARTGAGTQEDRWMIEVDLGSESGRTIARKLAVYVQHYRSASEQRQHGVYPRVLWTVPDERRAEQITEILDRQPAETLHLFSVCQFDQAVAIMAAEARI
jgi:hypothetical protein